MSLHTPNQWVSVWHYKHCQYFPCCPASLQRKVHTDSIKSLIFHFHSIVFCWLIFTARFQACYFCFQVPFDSLISCFSSFLLEEGSSACTERPPCTSKDFFQIHTPCDKEGKVSRRHDTIFQLTYLIAISAFENKVVLFRNPSPTYFPSFASSIESEALGLLFACPSCLCKNLPGMGLLKGCVLVRW